MTKREKQYTDWVNFHRRRKRNPPVVTKHTINGMECFKIITKPNRCRVPDTILKKMSIYD